MLTTSGSDSHRPWPDRYQGLLLHAALSPKEEALAAWQTWRAEVAIEDIHPDPASFRLLPLVYHAVSQHAADEPLLARLRGIYRNRWVRNQLVWRSLAAAYASLQTAGIAALVLGNAPLLLGYNLDAGSRPLEPAGLLVRASHVASAVDLLLAAGWRPRDGRPVHLIVPAQQVRAQLAFVNADEQVCVLQWRLVEGAQDEASLREACWSAAQPVASEQLSAPTFCPADHLLLLCLHAWQGVPPPPVDWLADAVVILRHEGEQMDWPRLLRLTAWSGAAPVVRDVLAYLAEQFAVKVPASVLQTLAELPVSAQARRLYDLWSRGGAPATGQGALAQGYAHYQWLAALHAGRRELAFPEFVRLYFGKSDQSQLLTWAVRRLLRA